MRAAPAAAMPARGASTWGVRCLCDGVPGRPPWEEVKAKDKAKVKAQAELLERLEREKSPEAKEIEREDAMEDQRHAVLDMARAREKSFGGLHHEPGHSDPVVPLSLRFLFGGLYHERRFRARGSGRSLLPGGLHHEPWHSDPVVPLSLLFWQVVPRAAFPSPWFR